MNVAETILARGDDSAVAVLQKDFRLTYRELREQVARLAFGLLARGHQRGDRIGIWSENSPFFIIAYLAVMRAGLVAVPLQTELPPDAFAKIITEAGITEVLVSEDVFYNRLMPAWAEKAGVALLPEGQMVLGESSGKLPEIDPARDLAALMFTSGSTGAPKRRDDHPPQH